MPTIPEALNVAHQAAQEGDHRRAQFIYEQILQAAPDEPNAHNALGMLLLEAGQLDAAGHHLRSAISACPNEPILHNNLYLILARQGRLDEAVACCREAVALNSSSPELHNNLGVALKAAGQLVPAAASFRDAIEHRAGYAVAHYNLANTLVLLRRLDEAEGEFRAALQLAPHDADVHNNLGALVRLRGRLAEAAQRFETALALRPTFAEAHRNRAVLRLLQGDFAHGFEEYEWRWQTPDSPPRTFAQPRWQGEPLAGRTILLWSEQGLGDTIQFIRYAPLLRERGARVLVDCRPMLHALLRGTPGVDAFVDGRTPTEPFDFQIPLLSLPAVCGTRVESIPASVPYLHAESQRIARWRRELESQGSRLKALGRLNPPSSSSSDLEPLALGLESSSSSSLQPAASRLFRVGIAWQGSTGFQGDFYRSIPLAAFAPLAACPGVRWLSLQHGHGSEQLAALASAWEIVDLASTFDEDSDAFVDTAAAMMSLDLVITSDTAIAHLAGALGVKVWVALQETPNWRWLLNRDDSPWYPTMRLFRQSRLGQWSDVFARMADELQSLLPPRR